MNKQNPSAHTSTNRFWAIPLRIIVLLLLTFASLAFISGLLVALGSSTNTILAQGLDGPNPTSTPGPASNVIFQSAQGSYLSLEPNHVTDGFSN